jgi:hypothetical protein
MNLAELWPDVNQMEGREGYRGERKCVQCQQKATQVRTQPVFLN